MDVRLADTANVRDSLAGPAGEKPAARPFGFADWRSIDHRPLLAALLTGIGYYAGAKIGLALTFQPHPISVLWPPNAILLGALLVSPVRWWWLLIAAALPAHLNAELDANVPTAMVFCWFASNVAEALIGAACVRRLLRAVPAFDTFRDVAVFLACAVFLAPFLTSFLDAAFVKAIGWGEGGYWQLWRMRFFSNVLTTLTVAPVIVSFVASLSRWRSGSATRALEAGVLLAGLAAASIAVFDSLPVVFGASPALLYLPLPFLLWAALRFGPGVTTVSFLVLAFVTIWGASHGQGPFSASAPAQNAAAVQMFLTFVGITLLSLVAALQERRRTELQLRRSEERFATAFRSNPDAALIKRVSDGRVIEINDRWEETFGHPRANVVGRTIESLGIYASAAERAKFLAQANDQGRIRDLEVVLRARDGREVYAHIAAETAEMAGEPCFIVTVRDFTEQRRVEMEMREQGRQLMHLTRVAALGELSGALAHELNQPLTAILSNAQAARRFLMRDPVDLAEVRAIIDDIVESDKRAGAVILRLRAMLKKGEVQFAAVDLNDLLRDVLDLAHGELVTRNVAVVTRFNPGVPQIHGDRVELQQLFLNLVSNACEAMSTRDRSQRTLTIETLYGWDGTVQVAVSDRGWGIPPERLERIFEPFFTTREQGLGLGLAICRTIVKTHGGHLWAENSSTGGAVFRVNLPIQRGEHR